METKVISLEERAKDAAGCPPQDCRKFDEAAKRGSVRTGQDDRIEKEISGFAPGRFLHETPVSGDALYQFSQAIHNQPQGYSKFEGGHYVRPWVGYPLQGPDKLISHR